jgi:peptide-methionine (S)-S-oxide reductase
MSSNLDTAVFGAGCFWCVEAIFQNLKGVQSVESGYSGGTVENPSYKEVCTGTTGHAEVAKIIFDPSVISYDELLEVFWTTHDPTTLNRQGADVGTQYRSVIFYLNDKQKESAEKSKKEIAPQIWDDPVVTEINPLTNFYKAEDYHQNYYNENPDQSYCKYVINPKLEKFRKKFNEKLKE